MGQACLPSIWVDGTVTAPASRTFGSFDLESVLAVDIEAIEMYTGPATVPTDYATGSGCGAILIWTRK